MGKSGENPASPKTADPRKAGKLCRSGDAPCLKRQVGRARTPTRPSCIRARALGIEFFLYQALLWYRAPRAGRRKIMLERHGLYTQSSELDTLQNVPPPVDGLISQEIYDLDKVFPIAQEIAYLQARLNEGVPKDKVLQLAKLNLFRLLGEHLAELDYQPYHYEIKEVNGIDRLSFIGHANSIVEDLRSTARNLREEVEAEALEVIERRLLKEGNNVAIQISPPSFGMEGFGNYGFAFVFIREENMVRTYALRYEGEDEDFSKSGKIFSKLIRTQMYEILGSQGTIQDNNEYFYLSSPLATNIENPKVVLETLQQIIREVSGTEVDPSKTEEFYNLLEGDPIIAEVMGKYYEAVLKKDAHYAKIARRIVYNRAKELLELNEKWAEGWEEEISPSMLDLHLLKQSYGTQVYITGSSCPSMQKVAGGISLGLDVYPTSSGILGLLEDEFGSLQFECPNCGRVLTRPFGRFIENCYYCGADVSC